MTVIPGNGKLSKKLVTGHWSPKNAKLCLFLVGNCIFETCANKVVLSAEVLSANKGSWNVMVL